MLHHFSGLGGQANSGSQRDVPSRPPLGTINVIFAAPSQTGSCPSRVMYVARLPSENINQELKRARVEWSLVMGFSNEDKIGTIQPHDDSLMITLRIGGYDVKRVMVDQGQIKLPVQTGSEIMEVDFIIVDAYSPYTAIVARPWLHTLGAVSSTLHQKVKYSSGGQIKEILGDQAMAWQCMIAAIQHKPKAEPLARVEKGL